MPINKFDIFLKAIDQVASKNIKVANLLKKEVLADANLAKNVKSESQSVNESLQLLRQYLSEFLNISKLPKDQSTNVFLTSVLDSFKHLLEEHSGHINTGIWDSLDNVPDLRKSPSSRNEIIY